jgi:hypothetical protein
MVKIFLIKIGSVNKFLYTISSKPEKSQQLNESVIKANLPMGLYFIK